MAKIKQLDTEKIEFKMEKLKQGPFKQKEVFVPCRLCNVQIWDGKTELLLATSQRFCSVEDARAYVLGYMQQIELDIDWLIHNRLTIAMKLDPERARANRLAAASADYVAQTETQGSIRYGETTVEYPMSIQTFSGFLVLERVELTLGEQNTVEQLYLEIGFDPALVGTQKVYIHVDSGKNIVVSEW